MNSRMCVLMVLYTLFSLIGMHCVYAADADSVIGLLVYESHVDKMDLIKSVKESLAAGEVRNFIDALKKVDTYEKWKKEALLRPTFFKESVVGGLIFEQNKRVIQDAYEDMQMTVLSDMTQQAIAYTEEEIRDAVPDFSQVVSGTRVSESFVKRVKGVLGYIVQFRDRVASVIYIGNLSEFIAAESSKIEVAMGSVFAVVEKEISSIENSIIPSTLNDKEKFAFLDGVISTIDSAKIKDVSLEKHISTLINTIKKDFESIRSQYQKIVENRNLQQEQAKAVEKEVVKEVIKTTILAAAPITQYLQNQLVLLETSAKAGQLDFWDGFFAESSGVSNIINEIFTDLNKLAVSKENLEEQWSQYAEAVLKSLPKIFTEWIGTYAKTYALTDLDALKRMRDTMPRTYKAAVGQQSGKLPHQRKRILWLKIRKDIVGFFDRTIAGNPVSTIIKPTEREEKFAVVEYGDKGGMVPSTGSKLAKDLARFDTATAMADLSKAAQATSMSAQDSDRLFYEIFLLSLVPFRDIVLQTSDSVDMSGLYTKLSQSLRMAYLMIEGLAPVEGEDDQAKTRRRKSYWNQISQDVLYNWRQACTIWLEKYIVVCLQKEPTVSGQCRLKLEALISTLKSSQNALLAARGRSDVDEVLYTLLDPQINAGIAVFEKSLQIGTLSEKPSRSVADISRALNTRLESFQKTAKEGGEDFLLTFLHLVAPIIQRTHDDLSKIPQDEKAFAGQWELYAKDILDATKQIFEIWLLSSIQRCGDESLACLEKLAKIKGEVTQYKPDTSKITAKRTYEILIHIRDYIVEQLEKKSTITIE